MKTFGDFRLDTVNHCLWRGDQRMPLAPKAFDVLRYLVEHCDRLVNQNEILEALWPATYVNPEVVKKYVLRIRKVLGDQSNKPAFVATFPRRGYQFIAPVREEISSDAGTAPSGIKTMVGRASAVAELKDALNKALQGQRQIVFITGEAGIGKTTLLDAFHKQSASGSRVRIVRGQCVEGFGGKEAYYPILEALGQLLRDAENNSIVQAFAQHAPTWLVQFPSLVKAEQREALEKSVVGTTRERMVREICETLEAVSLQTPLLLCLEDLHWVDPSTLDFISALARRRGPAKLLLLGTYRPADVILSQSPLKLLKQDLVLHHLCREVALERLEEADVAEYLSVEFVESSFPAGLAPLIYRHSNGNALFMVTILQDMVKKCLIAQCNGEWALTLPLENVDPSVPETLQQLIEAQFQQLSAQEQSVLRTACVAGERFAAWAIAIAPESEPGGVEEVCQGLAERLQFIKAAGIRDMAKGPVSAHFEFRHSLYREVLYRRLSEGNRSRLHRLLAQRLHALPDAAKQELATELSLHFERGYEYEHAVRYLILAANNAAGRFAYRDAIEILHHALELVGKLEAEHGAELEIQIQEFMGDAHFVLGAMAESVAAYEAAVRRADQAGRNADQVRLLTCLLCPFSFTEPQLGIAAMEQALQVCSRVEDPVLFARTQMLAASNRLVFDGWRQADADVFASAHQTLLRLDDSETHAYQRMIYAHILTLQGKYREALEIFETGISRVDFGIGLITHFIAVSGKTLALLRLGEFGEVLRITRAGRELAAENLARSWLFDFREAWLRMIAFDFDGAQGFCKTPGESTASYLTGQRQIIGQVSAGYLALARQKYDQATEHFRQVRNPEVPTKFFLHWMWRMNAELESGNVWLLSGKVSEARAAADRFLQSALSTADPHLQALAWELQARVAMAENDGAGAREAIQHSLAIVDSFEIPVAAWQTHAAAWQFYQQAKEHKAAEANRQRAEACILKIANSFAPDEPLRATFLAAAPIRRILGAGVENQVLPQRAARRSVASGASSAHSKNSG